MSCTDGVLTILNVVVLLPSLILLGMSWADYALNRDVVDDAAQRPAAVAYPLGLAHIPSGRAWSTPLIQAANTKSLDKSD